MPPPRHSAAILPFSTILHGQRCHIHSIAFLRQQHRREGSAYRGCTPSRNMRQAGHNRTLLAVSIADDVDLGRVSILPFYHHDLRFLLGTPFVKGRMASAAATSVHVNHPSRSYAHTKRNDPTRRSHSMGYPWHTVRILLVRTLHRSHRCFLREGKYHDHILGRQSWQIRLRP